MKKNKAFTLIELIAVLVILAILALIVTPLVMNIIRKARISADRRSIDAYGRSIELAIATYLLDEGKFPTSINDLTIEYSGATVVCSTTQLNKDSSIYLSDCKVNNKLVKGYSYGNDSMIDYKSYEVGDRVIYNKSMYYVIEKSESSNKILKLLKAEPLKYNEIWNLNIDGLELRWSNNGSYGITSFGNSPNYSNSSVKKIVDAWKDSIIKSDDSAIARLITIDEVTNLGYEWFDNGSIASWKRTEFTPEWLRDSSGSSYWTGSSVADSNSVWEIYGIDLNKASFTSYKSIRPVLEIHKTSNIEDLYQEYKIGDKVSYNDVTYYVIEDSNFMNDTVKLLKENPLSSSEISDLNLSGINAEGMYVPFGDSPNYSTSVIKQVVDAWSLSAVKQSDTAIARLISYDDLTDNLGFEKSNASTIIESSNGVTPSWVYSQEYTIWTMSQKGDSSSVWFLYDEYGRLRASDPSNKMVVRPVLELKKTADIIKLNS